MKNPSRLSAVLAAVASVLLFSTGGLSIKLLPLAALPIAGLRGLIAAIFLGLLLIKQGRGKTLCRMSRYGWMGAASYVLMTTTYVMAMKMTTAANAIFLQYTMPAWVMAGGALWLGEKITFGRVLTIGLSLLGMAFFFTGELRPGEWRGNGLALFSGLTFAGVILALRRDRERGPLDSVFWGNAANAIFVIPLAAINNPGFWQQLSSPAVWAGLLWLGVFQIGVGYILYIFALKGLLAVEVAILSLIEPVLNPTWVFLANGETPSLQAFLGGAVILAAVLFYSLHGQGEAELSS